jgi:CHAT domain-containing protein
VSVIPPKVEELLKLIPADETLVEYFAADGQFYAFVLTNKGLKGFKLEGEQVGKDVELFRAYIQTSPEKIRGIKLQTGGEQGADKSNALYATLIQPLKDSIKTKNLTIVPHGALHYLPFAALSDGKKYLIDSYNLRVLPSTSVLTFLKDQKSGHAGNLLAFGNPDLNDPSLDLPGAEAESTAIAAKVSGSTLFTKKQATETALKTVGGEYRYVHFATHGTFNPDEPLTSGLLLAADNQNDGTLTVRELYDLNLPADLVTLSACETALGKVANGDDVVGFTRGFLYAGTSSIVSSLWKVDDSATSELMQKFYGGLKKNTKRDALRSAQLYIKDKYNAHPYYWAAFQLTGNVN